MANSLVTKLTCVMLLCMVAGAPLAQATVTCGQVSGSLAKCIPYLTGKGPASPDCCAGVKSLNGAATTTPDRQQVCTCLKSAAGSISGIDYKLASGLPGKCGVSIPYDISPSTDCASIK